MFEVAVLRKTNFAMQRKRWIQTKNVGGKARGPGPDPTV
jgi:hypothetical protein